MTKVGFVGCGQMAMALARGCVRANVIAASNITLSDTQQAALETAAKEGFCTTQENNKIFQDNDIVVLAVKPQYFEEALTDVKSGSNTLIVSIMAGITLQTLHQQLAGILNSKPRIIRVMPNVCCLIGAAASVFSANENCSQSDIASVEKILQAAGTTSCLPESAMDAVTGLSGSGPAYGFLMIEAMSDAGVKLGLPRNVATTLAAQTLLGAGKMVLDTNQHPMALKDSVCSPAGTTIAGVAALEKGGFRAAVISAVEAAADRATQLGINN